MTVTTRIYPSCLCNRIAEARRHFPTLEMGDSRSVVYPYSLIDLAVRMRPVVAVINSAKKIDRKIELCHFEPSWWFDGNKKYVNANEVSITVLLGAMIHEFYLHVGPTNDSGGRQRLDIASDRGRWIVYYDDYVATLRRYLLNTDEVAETVCDMIDNHQELVNKHPEIRWKAPPNIGNLDLDWLLWVYLSENANLKRAILSDVFDVKDVSIEKVTVVRFSANSVGHETFNLHLSPVDWNPETENRRTIRWVEFSKFVRSWLSSCRV